MDDISQALQAKSPRFMDQLRLNMRKSGLAYRTEQTCVHRARRFILFHNKRHLHNKRHPRDMGNAEILAFLARPAVDRRRCASTLLRRILHRG